MYSSDRRTFGVETTEFWRELWRLRLHESGCAGQREGVAAFAKRLGVSKHIMDSFRKGSIPSRYTISNMMKSAGYGNSTALNLIDATGRDLRKGQPMQKQTDYTRFYEELDKLRLDDAASPTGKESDRALGVRLGITNKTITLYRRGAQPKASTIRQIVERGGYGPDLFHRLSAAAAGEDMAKPMSESSVNVYLSKDVDSGGPKKTARSLFNFVPPILLNKKWARSTLVCVKLDDDFQNCEPVIPRGSCVLYSNVPSDPENYKTFMFATEKGAVPRMVRVHGRQLWWTKNDINDLEKIERDDFDNAVLGEVVLVLNLMMKVE